ncbi:MAG: HAD family hydrolase [Defluviitoga tunisiensis]
MLINGAKDVLEYLCGKYKLGILTNGFRKTQLAKLNSSGIDKYFKILVSSEDIGFPKPDEKIFSYAQKVSGYPKEKIAYIGDDLENDILPAIKFGMHAIWFKNNNSFISNLPIKDNIVDNRSFIRIKRHILNLLQIINSFLNYTNIFPRY